jgi:hypothetical protein
MVTSFGQLRHLLFYSTQMGTEAIRTHPFTSYKYCTFPFATHHPNKQYCIHSSDVLEIYMNIYLDVHIDTN